MAGGATAVRYRGDAAADSAVRIGLVLPSVNTVVEPWLPAVLPSGASLHVARMLMPDRLTPEGIIEMDRVDGARAVAQLASCRPASIVYACVASSVLQGVAYDRHLVGEMRHATGLPCETAIGATAAAMRALGLKRVAVVSPYARDVDAAEHAFLEASGHTILHSANFGISNAFELARPSAADIVEAALQVAGEADGVLLTCMNMRAHLAAAELERRLGRPVVATTVATAWAALRLAGVTAALPAFGRLGAAAWPAA